METQIQEYSQTAAALAILAERYKGATYDVTTAEGMGDAKKARAEIRGYRTGLEAKRVEIKAPALERCKQIDSEAARITAELVALEKPIAAQITSEEDRKEAEKQAAIKAEQDKIEAEQRALREAQEKKLAEERADIARRQAELDAAEKARVEAERQSRAKIEAEERAARERIEATEREARKLREEADAIVRRAQQAAEDKERAAPAVEENRLRGERLQQEAKERAERKAANDLTDARGMLASFVERYGNLKEFAEVVKAIQTYQQRKAAQ